MEDFFIGLRALEIVLSNQTRPRYIYWKSDHCKQVKTTLLVCVYYSGEREGEGERERGRGRGREYYSFMFVFLFSLFGHL